MPIAGNAVMRAADAMLRALGDDGISLVLPLPSASADPGSQLGLSDPGVRLVPISPVVVRNLPGTSGPSVRVELLISASAISDAVMEQGLGSPEALFDSAIGIQFQSSLLHVEQMTADYFGGVAYLYRVIAVE